MRRIMTMGASCRADVLTGQAPGRWSAIALALLLAAGGALTAGAQEVSKVAITAPVGTAPQPFRTSFSQLAVEFNHDGGNVGAFISQSVGADVNGTNFLVNESSGSVGAFFSTPGLKTVSVRVTRSPTGTPAISAPTVLAFDNVPPTVRILQIRVDPRLSFETFVPGKVYFTSADAIDLRGIATDPAPGTPSAEIELTAGAVGAGQVSASPDATGQFEIAIPLTGLPDGPFQVFLRARDRMSDNSPPNVGSAPGVRFGS